MKTLLIYRLMISALALVASAANAAEPYIGLSRATPGEARVAVGPDTTTGNDNRPSAFKLYAGLSFDPAWSVEVGYGAFGSWRFSDPAPGASEKMSIGSSAVTIAARYSLDLGDSFTAFGKLGLAANRFHYDNSLGQSKTGSFVRPMCGFGVEVKLGEHLSVPLEFE